MSQIDVVIKVITDVTVEWDLKGIQMESVSTMWREISVCGSL